MAFREVSVNEIREVLRVWLGVAGLPAPGYRTIAAHCGVDRKTVRRYVEAAQVAGLRRDGDVSALDDGLIGVVAEAVRPARPDVGHGEIRVVLQHRIYLDGAAHDVALQSRSRVGGPRLPLTLFPLRDLVLHQCDQCLRITCEHARGLESHFGLLAECQFLFWFHCLPSLGC